MGKAARRRKAYQLNKLVSLSYDNPPVFIEQWDMRVESWLIEVRKLSAEWRQDQSTKERAFAVLENAMSVLACCEPNAAAIVEKRTYRELCDACAIAVAEQFSPEIYRLSNFAGLKYNSRKGKGPYGLETHVP